MPGLYDDAQTFDILHAPGTAAEARGLLRIARRFGAIREKGTPVLLEPACGSGRYLRALAATGCRVFGFDRSATMVWYARNELEGDGLRVPMSRGRVPGATVFRAGLARFALPLKADAAFTTINRIRHLASDRAMLAHMSRVRSALTRRGVYIVGLSLSLPGAESPSEDVWIATRAGVRVTQVAQYLPPGERRREWVHSHLTIEWGGFEEHRDSRYWLRCYTRGQWESLVRRAGFRTLGIVDEQGRDADPGTLGYALWVLGKVSRSRGSG